MEENGLPVERDKDPGKFIFCTQCNQLVKHTDGSEIWNHFTKEHGARFRTYQYLCRLCGKRFERTGHLNQHIKRCHVLESRFRCFYCGRHYESSIELQVHENSCHDPVTIKNYIGCRICGKILFSPEMFYNHLKHHMVACKSIPVRSSFQKTDRLRGNRRRGRDASSMRGGNELIQRMPCCDEVSHSNLAFEASQASSKTAINLKSSVNFRLGSEGSTPTRTCDQMQGPIRMCAFELHKGQLGTELVMQYELNNDNFTVGETLDGEKVCLDA